jgi:hypothetical protein
MVYTFQWGEVSVIILWFGRFKVYNSSHGSKGHPFVYFLHRSTKDDDLLWHVSCPAYLLLASPVTSSLGLPDLAIEDRRLTTKLQLWGGTSEARSGVDLDRLTRLVCGANLRGSAWQNESSGFGHRESQVLGENYIYENGRKY